MLIKVWLAANLLFIQQPINDLQLTIKNEEETLATINKDDIVISNPGFPIIDIEKTSSLVKKLEKKLYKAAMNAKIGDDGQIVPEQVGSKLNRHDFLNKYYMYFYDEGPSTIELKESPIYPRVDSELLSQIKARRIGAYITFYNAYNVSRSHNIFLAADAIDNHVVFPNETFSFNEIVGMRTKEKGYLLAPIIVRGELSEGIGGGICQVSSTLFNGVDKVGLKIVERYSHSRKVPYVPPGRDATVSWYGPDFRFKNQFNQPILIRAKNYRGSLVISLYSSEDINLNNN